MGVKGRGKVTDRRVLFGDLSCSSEDEAASVCPHVEHEPSHPVSHEGHQQCQPRKERKRVSPRYATVASAKDALRGYIGWQAESEERRLGVQTRFQDASSIPAQLSPIKAERPWEEARYETEIRQFASARSTSWNSRSGASPWSTQHSPLVLSPKAGADVQPPGQHPFDTNGQNVASYFVPSVCMMAPTERTIRRDQEPSGSNSECTLSGENRAKKAGQDPQGVRGQAMQPAEDPQRRSSRSESPSADVWAGSQMSGQKFGESKPEGSERQESQPLAYSAGQFRLIENRLNTQQHRVEFW